MPYFTASTLAFFRALARHNDRVWFEARRLDYETHVRAPMRAFVEEMDVRLGRVAPEIVGDPVRSVFRIHRDIRFSRDKSPYKTHVACWFFHREGRAKVGREAEGGGAGFYLQIAPGDSFVGGGLWRPPRPALNRLRLAIANDPRGFACAADGPAVRRRFGGLSDESVLKRVPRGFDEHHPAARWLRFQSFTLGRALTDAQATSARLPALAEEDFALMTPLVRWLNGALGFQPATRR
jgi:uncharacterized protein (TIGR02453 family)